MKLYKHIGITILACISFFQVSASHLMGGEITWKCQDNGSFKFSMKVYRDCNGVQFATPVQMDVHNYPGLTQIQMNAVSYKDISPIGFNKSSVDSCPNCLFAGGKQGVVEEITLQSGDVFLTGTPPANGWVFSFSSCCRSGSISNLATPNSIGFTLRAVMFPYNGQNTNPCYDSSPEFAEIPSTVTCDGYPFQYSQGTFDSDYDSTLFEFGKPLDSWSSGSWSTTNPNPAPFGSGYTYNYPLPGPNFNPLNSWAAINSITGIISFTCFTPGNYVTVVKCSSFRCGILISEIYREIIIALIDCPTILGSGLENYPPIISFPFQNANTGLYTEIADSVIAGDVIDFYIHASDSDSIPLFPGNLQLLTMESSGSQFGAGFTDSSTGCQIPPCATLNLPPPLNDTGQVETQFHWATTCNHIGSINGCVTVSNTYRFLVKVKDNFCPANGSSLLVYYITVLPPLIARKPKIHCVNVDSNGDIDLTWQNANDSLNIFKTYYIYHSLNKTGPYTLLDSIPNLIQTNYTHMGANGMNQQHFYYFQTQLDCGSLTLSQPSDTVSNIMIKAISAGNGLIALTWNPIRNPLLLSSLKYYHVWREYPLGTWQYIDSASNNFLIDTLVINTCTDSMNYKIVIADSIGCISSNTTHFIFNNFTASTINIDTCDQYTSPSGNYTWTQSGTYRDTVTNFAGCDSIITISLTISAVNVAVTQVNNSLIANLSGAAYQWLDCNNGFAIIPGQTNQTFVPTSIGSYAVIVWENGCVDTSACYNVIGVGFESNTFGDKIFIHPNPTTGSIKIEFGTREASIKTMLTDVNGKLLQSEFFKNKQQIQFNITQPDGVYLLKIEAGNNAAVVRIVKQ